MPFGQTTPERDDEDGGGSTLPPRGGSNTPTYPPENDPEPDNPFDVRNDRFPGIDQSINGLQEDWRFFSDYSQYPEAIREIMGTMAMYAEEMDAWAYHLTRADYIDEIREANADLTDGVAHAYVDGVSFSIDINMNGNIDVGENYDDMDFIYGVDSDNNGQIDFLEFVNISAEDGIITG